MSQHPPHNHQPLPFEDFDLESVEEPENINDTLKLLPIGYQAGVRSREMLTSFSQKYIHSSQEFTLSGVIGQGGMGIVYLGQEHLPERQVAIKKLKPEKKRLAKVLLKEALTMGRLNHPNIPPVYQVQFDDEDCPEVVMRKIEGQTFQEILNGSPQTDVSLRESLAILIQVCHAVEFAHSQGILHRDIKPDNIMVGQFNQVYLMDWGIAINLNEENENTKGLAGTPSYMAPEMLSGDPAILTASSDVFLLGATLHEILTGKPRHNGAIIKDALVAAYECSVYSYSKETPQPLADLCNWACARDPKDRPQTALRFKTELENFLSHWEALRLTEKGFQTLSQYKTLWEKEKDSKRINSVLLNQLAYQAKFSFEQARDIWADVAGAQQGLTEVIELMIYQALQTNQQQSALLLYQENSLYFDRRITLKDKVHQAFLSLEEKKQTQLELKKIEKAFDPTITLEPQYLLICVLLGSTLLSIASHAISVILLEISVDTRGFFLLALLTTVPVWLAIVVLYQRLTINNIGQLALRTIAFETIGLFFIHFSFWQLQAPVALLASMDCVVIALAYMNSNPAIKHGSRLAVGALSGALLCIVFPKQGYILFELILLFTSIMVLRQWRQVQDVDHELI